MKIGPLAGDLFRAVAPTLGAALGGPLGLAVASVAVKVLDHYVPRKPGEPATPEDIAAAAEKHAHDPQFTIDLKRAELAVKDYELRMRREDNSFSLKKLPFEDLRDARASAKDSGLSRPMFMFGMGFVALAILSLFGIVGFGFYVLKGGFVVSSASLAIVPVVFNMVGSVITALVGVMMLVLGFYYGSSAGSREKTAQIGAAVQDLGTAIADRPLASPPPVVVVPTVVPPTAPEEPVQAGWRQGPHGGQRWRLEPLGVVQEGEGAPMRTVGQPVTVRRIWAAYGPHILSASERYLVPLELIVATIATESGGKADATLAEPRHNDKSVGLTQIMVGTAQQFSATPLTAAALMDPATNIAFGTRYIASQRKVTDFAPPLVAAAYNAGGLYPPREGDENPWGLRSTGDHITRFCRYYGDACAVAHEDGWGKAAAA